MATTNKKKRTAKKPTVKKVKISVTRALRELKLINSRIETQTGKLTILDVTCKKFKGQAMQSKTTVDDFKELAVTRYNVITSLLKRKQDIKSALLISNIKTKVKVGSKSMTVAGAIEYKHVITFEKSLLEKIKKQMKYHKETLDEARDDLDEQLTDMFKANISKDRRTDEKDIKVISDFFKEENELKSVDPLKAQKKIDALEERIAIFESDIDIVLSESNSKTEIQINE